jgi:hypothetical protein
MGVDDRGIKDRPQEDRDLSHSLQYKQQQVRGVVARKNRQSSGTGHRAERISKMYTKDTERWNSFKNGLLQ